jgi:c-di-GMP-binding flagellar brake protein YcgR
MGESSLIRLKKADVVVGRPLPWAVFDSHNNLLLNQGFVIQTEKQVDVLLEKGLYRRPGRQAARPEWAGEEERKPDKEPAGEQVSLDQLGLKPGDTLQLQPMLEGATERYSVRVIGEHKPESVLVTAPEVDGKLVFVREGQTFYVRGFIGKDALAFRTRVLKSQLSPFAYLHLAYPDGVQCMRVRKSVRVEINVIADIQSQRAGAQQLAGRISDLSTSGARVITDQAFAQPDEPVIVSFKVAQAGMEEYVKAESVVRGITVMVEKGRQRTATGVEFVAMSDTHRLFLMNLIYQSLVKEPI